MVDRIKQIMEHVGMTPALFAETIGINRSNLTHLFSGRNQPSLDLAKKILNAFPEIKTEWLIMGVGDMLQSVDNKVVSQPERKIVQPDLFGEEFSEKSVNDTDVVEKQIDTLHNIPKDTVIEKKTELQGSIADSENGGDENMVSRSGRRTTRSKSNIPIESARRSQKINSQEDKIVKKIVFFYNDNTFETFYPQN